MALEITPRPQLDNMMLGEEIACKINITKELDINTVDTYTYKIYDSSDTDVTTNFTGGTSIANGTITFGFKGYAIGEYRLEFWVTCVELLPNEVTPYEFTFEMFVNIEA
jgi:hypothetical protein